MFIHESRVQGKCITQYQPGKKELPWVGLEPTTLCFLDRVLFLLSYQGSSASRALSLQYNTTQDKVKPQYGIDSTEKPSLNMHIGAQGTNVCHLR